MRVEDRKTIIFAGLVTAGAGLALVHFLKTPNPTLAAPLTDHAIKPVKLPETIGMESHTGAICVRPEIFPASLAEGCTPDPRTFLKEIEEYMAASKPLTRLYLLETPEGPVRLGVILNYEGPTKVGFLTIGKGIGLLMDGPSSDVRNAFEQALRQLGSKYDLGLRAVMSASVAGGCGPINQTVWS